MIGDSDTNAISQNVNFMKTSLFTPPQSLTFMVYKLCQNGCKNNATFSIIQEQPKLEL